MCSRYAVARLFKCALDGIEVLRKCRQANRKGQHGLRIVIVLGEMLQSEIDVVDQLMTADVGFLYALTAERILSEHTG